VVAAMGRALRVHAGQTWSQWSTAGFAIGLLEPVASAAGELVAAVTPDQRHHLWMAGEAFSGDGDVDPGGCEGSRTLEFRRRLALALARHGPRVLAALDGEYLVVLWDSRARALTLLGDRFGGLPLYWARSREGFAFVSGVRGALM